MTVNTEVRRYPFGAPIRLDMDPLYAKLRREEPVSRVELPYGGQGWLVTRYDDVRTVLADPGSAAPQPSIAKTCRAPPPRPLAPIRC